MDDEARGVNFSDLPIEMIVHVFRFLGHSDRQAAGATCTRWYEAVCTAELNRYIVAHFANMRICDTDDVVCSFNHSKRSIHQFELENVRLSEAPEFLSKLASLARSVTLHCMVMSVQEFRNFIAPLKKLEMLAINNCADLMLAEPCAAEGDTEFDETLAQIKKFALHGNINRTWCDIMPGMRSLYCFEFSDTTYDAILFDQLRHGPDDEYEAGGIKLSLLLPHLPSLRELNFRATCITSANLLKMHALADGRLNMKRLDLSMCHSLGKDFGVFLKTQPQLVYLDLTFIGMTDEGLMSITECLPMLEILYIPLNYELTDFAAVTLQRLKRLERINLAGCSGITDGGVICGIASHDNALLSSVNLNQLRISMDTVNALAKHLQGLRVLNLNFCTDAVNDEAVQLIIKHFNKLLELTLRGCEHITDAALTGLNLAKLQSGDAVSEAEAAEGLSIAHMRGLQVLVISECEQISDITLEHGLKLIEMYTLDISYCPKITPKGIKALVQNSPAIEDLNLSHCLNITNAAIEQVAIHLKRLSRLNVDYCEQLTPTALEAIKDHCTQLKALEIYGCRHLYESTTHREVFKHLRKQIMHCNPFYPNDDEFSLSVHS